MRNLSGLLILFLSLNLSAQGTSDLPFQVLIAKDANAYGTDVKPLQMIDDVTSIGDQRRRFFEFGP